MSNELKDQLIQTPNNLLGLYGLGDYNTQQIKVFARSYNLEGLSPKKFYDRRPDAAPDAHQYISSISPEDAAFIVPDAFAGDVGMMLLSNMRIEQLEKIGSGSDPFLKLAIKHTLQRIIIKEKDNISPQIKKLYEYIFFNPAWQF